MVHAAPAACTRAWAWGPAAALALLAATGAARGQAATLPAQALELAAALAAELARDLAQARAPAGARVVALPGALDPRLRLAPCADIRPLPSPGAPAWGRTRVQLQCARGAVAWRITLPMQVQVWAPAWVAAAPRFAGEVLAAGQLVPGVVDWAAAPTPPLPLDDSPEGRTLARSLGAGEALREADLRARQWFVAGDTVQVTARGSGYAVQAEALALSPGIEGRPARLKSVNGRVFTATPVAERRAEVAL
jgi:flagellar basal body P-ring formation protein FlgA